MILNNIECDLDELIRQHGDHKVEAIRELRRLTGLTLKESKKILDDYEKGNSYFYKYIKRRNSRYEWINKICHLD